MSLLGLGASSCGTSFSIELLPGTVEDGCYQEDVIETRCHLEEVIGEECFERETVVEVCEEFLGILFCEDQLVIEEICEPIVIDIIEVCEEVVVDSYIVCE